MSSILEDGKHTRRRESLPGGRAGENVAYLQQPPKMRVRMLAHSEMAASVRPRRPWFAVRRLIAGEERDDGGDREDDEDDVCVAVPVLVLELLPGIDKSVRSILEVYPKL